MQRTKIEWVKNQDGTSGYVWNPVRGCKNNCWYCYARKINNRFKFTKRWTNPYIVSFDELSKTAYKIRKLKKPSAIFVGSMSDLFGDWIDKIFLKQIFHFCKDTPQHIFLFLTKNPKRYNDFLIPKNCYIGMTITGEEDNEKYPTGVSWKLAEVSGIKAHKFVSIEPLLKEIRKKDIGYIATYFEWMIIGGLTPKPKHQKEWVDSLCWLGRPDIFIKDNIDEKWRSGFISNYRKIPYWK